ncbi:MAG TPA: DUF4135 domain-containing protein [Kofleriaceae bacterium]|jgi:hypothetical protein
MAGIASRPELRAAVIELVARSATFEERAAGAWLVTEPSPHDEVTAICRVVGLAPEALQLRGPIVETLARARVRDARVVPDWATALERLLDDPTPAPDDAGPDFASAFSGFVRTAGSWLDEALVGSPTVAIDAEARAGLLDWLRRSLVHPARFVLSHELAASPCRSPREYVASHLASRRDWLALLNVYPVLARLLATSFASWQRGCTELLHRLAADWTALGKSGAPALRDVSLLTLRHPPHRAPPLRITLPDGSRLVYKSKNLRTAAWVTELAQALSLEPRAIVARDDYGWADYVEASPCDDAGEVSRYFTRIGSYLRLFQALRATDMHGLNLVAAGEHPVFIDLEMVLQPARSERSGARDRYERSPLAVGLLPTWLAGEPGRRAVNVGGLNRGGRGVLPSRTSEALDVTPTLPMIGGTLATAAAHLPEIVAGYRSMTASLAGLELGARAAELRVAIQWRSGFMYEEVSEHSLAAVLLTDGRLRDAFLTRLGLGRPDDRARVIALHELHAIRDGAVPSFEASPASDALYVGDDGEVGGVFAAPALERVELVRAPIDEDRDLDAIASAIGLEAEACGDPAPVIEPRASSTAVGSPLDHAIALADFILDEATSEPAWIGASWDPTAGVRRLGVLPGDLLSGSAGLAVMFAYLYRRCGAPRFRDAARSVLALLSQKLQATAMPRGAFLGAGARLYALRKCAALLDDAALAELSRRCMATAVASASSTRDVISGDAGLLLVAANVFEAPPELEQLASRLREPTTTEHARYVDGTRWLAGLPGEREGVAWALARWDVASGRTPVIPDDASPLTRIACGGRVVLAEPRASTGDLVVTLAARDASQDLALTDHARCIADAIAVRRRETGRWLDDPYVADRYHLSAISGLAALALAFARIDAPELRCCARLVY